MSDTLLGRRRYLPELNERELTTCAHFGERCRDEQPHSGHGGRHHQAGHDPRGRGAARAAACKSRLILQVHDELIVEAPQEETQSAASLLKSCMENIVSLRVPLTAEVNIGRSWYDCK